MVYRAAGDGSVEVVSNKETIPFSNVTYLDADKTKNLKNVADYRELCGELNKLVEERGKNRFYMIRIDGLFKEMNVRSVRAQEEPYKPLVNVLEYDQTFFDYKDIEDGILIKSDGMPTYNFANVVDDHLMGITHVVRGNEYLSSSPKYNRLYDAFGWEVPTYVHCPLITDETHKKLSKRCGHSSYEDLIEQGFLTEAIVNFVALLGWSPEDDKEIFSLEELVEDFDFRHIRHRSGTLLQMCPSIFFLLLYIFF